MSYPFPEEIPDLHYTFENPVSNEEYKENGSRFPVFSFKDIDMGITDFSFSQTEFDNLHSKMLFDKLVKYSRHTFDELQFDLDHKEHFHIYSVPFGKLKNTINNWVGKQLRDEEIPMVGQFALYTHSDGADRSIKRKSPRIFFFVGRWAVFQLLFFDPYHEIKPSA